MVLSITLCYCNFSVTIILELRIVSNIIITYNQVVEQSDLLEMVLLQQVTQLE